MPLTLRALAPTDRPLLERVLRSDDTFLDNEVDVALELIDDALAKPASDYWFAIAVDDDPAGIGADGVVGYICFGPTPMTASSYDLYWIVVHSDARGRGVAGALIRHMESELAGRGATGIRIETSHLESYGSARHVYDRHAYSEVGRIEDFYREGDALVTFYKRL